MDFPNPQQPQSSNSLANKKTMHQLYTRVLEHRYNAVTESPPLECFRLVVGTVPILLQPLSVDSLGGLLDLSHGSIRSTLHRLKSIFDVTSYDHHLSVNHSSFNDFIFNEQACPPRFLINRAEQHTLIARRCLSIIKELPNDGAPPKACVTYAISYFDTHLCSATPESRTEFLGTIRTFAYSQIPKWLNQLQRAEVPEYAIPSIKQVYQWVAENFPEETELVAILNDLKWCIPQYYDDRGIEASELRQEQEASKWWSAAEESYLQLCGSKSDFLRKNAFMLGLGGEVKNVVTVDGDVEAIEEARRAVEKVVAHRCGLSQRQKQASNFLWKLASTFYDHHLELSVWVSRQRIDLLTIMGSAYDGSRADSLHNLGFYLSKLNKWEETIEPMRDAVAIRRALFAKSPGHYRPHIADSIHNLGYYLSECRRWKAAAELTQEALELRQALVADYPKSYRAELAYSLHNQGNFRNELDQWTEATELMEKAVELRRALYAERPDTYRVDLAWSFQQLGLFESKVKNWDAAVEATEQTVALRQALFSSNPQKYGPHLARSLFDLGEYQAQLGRWSEAVGVLEKCVSIREELLTQKVNGQRNLLVLSLQLLESYHSESGNEHQAAVVREKIVNMRQALIHEDDVSNKVDLSTWCNDFAWHLRMFGRPEKGLIHAQEAIDVIRGAPSMELPSVAHIFSCSLDTAAACLYDMGRFKEAIVYSEEAVLVLRLLHKNHPKHSGYLTNLIEVMGIHGKILEALGEREAAEKLAQEAAGFRL